MMRRSQHLGWNEPESTATRAQRILVVDPDEQNRSALCAHLVEAGFKVAEAADAMEGLQVLLDGEVNLVLCELQLPDLTGAWFVKQCRRAGVEAHFLMTGDSAGIEVADAMKNGAVGYLLKPLNAGLVSLALEEALASGGGSGVEVADLSRPSAACSRFRSGDG
jgi:DNA-binding NtrC family response regulator